MSGASLGAADKDRTDILVKVYRKRQKSFAARQAREANPAEERAKNRQRKRGTK